MKIRVCVVTGFGINCDRETQTAFEMAGASAERVHLNDLIAEASALDGFHILAIPGGFSFGDDIASGRIFANRMRYRLGESLRAFVGAKKPVIGICNGFQVLVKMGLLPMFDGEMAQTVTLTHNDSGRFENRWVELDPEPSSACVWTKGLGRLALPVRHGEGKFVVPDTQTYVRLVNGGHIALRYGAPDGGPAAGRIPHNPNGALDDIAGMCDGTGRVFGLMPHPEAHIRRTQHPRWYREDLPEEGPGLQLFRNGIAAAQNALTTPATARA